MFDNQKIDRSWSKRFFVEKELIIRKILADLDRGIITVMLRFLEQ